MEQSKLISGIIAKLKIAYPGYFKNLSKDDIAMLYKVYHEQIVGYASAVVIDAINKIIKNSKFMPSLAEILAECDSSNLAYKFSIIEKMKIDGYFKSPNEIEKSYRFIERNVIPYWLKEDMKKYGYQEYPGLINSRPNNLLGDFR